nr:ComEC/Rec2 family competence protein [Xenococcaceae cyanobacterium MO_188.B19]
LAHILAASGFHVSLLLGMVLRLTSSFQPKIKLWIGLSCLLLYSFLTGFSPSVIRAILMGSGVLIALCIGGKVKPLGSLFLSLIVILLVNPLWIWNLGLQLSFLATLGLIVSVPALEKKLDWMPPLLATTISVPIAASIWTLPLIIFTFNTVVSYSIFVNIVSMPLVTLISLGGMISSFISLISPSIGSLCASVLYYPCLFLIKVTEFFSNLPGSNISIGKISFFVVIIIYGSICLIWLNSKWNKRWRILLFSSITMIIIPITYSNLNLFQISVLATNKEPIILIQDRGETILINSGKNSNSVKYTIIPFLTSQGINKIHYGIALGRKYNSSQSWSYLQEKIPVQDLINENNRRLLLENKVIKTDLTEISAIAFGQSEIVIGEQGNILVIKTNKHNWLIADNLNKNNSAYIEDYIEENNLDIPSLVIVWSGNQSELKWLNELKPDVAIALSSRFQDKNSTIARRKLDLTYIIDEEGAVTWNPKMGFTSHFQSREYEAN